MRYNVYITQTIDHIIVVYRLASCIVACQILLDDDLHAHLVVATERVGKVLDIIYREVVVTSIFQVESNTLTLRLQYRDIEDIALVQQRVYGVGQDNRFEELVLEVVGYGADMVRLALFERVGNLCTLASVGGIDLVIHLRGVVATRVEVEF